MEPDNELPIITVSRGDKMFAHYRVFSHPVIIPSFHPDFTTARDFRDAVEFTTHHYCLSSISPQYPNGVAFVGTHDKSILTQGQFEKLGLVDQDIKLYRRLP